AGLGVFGRGAPRSWTDEFRMTKNTETVERYLDGFRRTDRSQVLSCLTDDVEWEIPGLFHARGMEQFGTHIVDEGFVGQPTMAVHGVTEAHDVVVVGGA